MKPNEPILVAHLFKPLDDMLMQLLQSLGEADWNKPTTAKKWTVKDVVSHLLDGNIRTLSLQRDHYYGDVVLPAIASHAGLVDWLNGLNADWIKATRRISPAVLTYLHQVTGDQVSRYYASLNLYGKAIFPVAWAGESESYAWMHLAREYTEKWHHQQQIREAVGKEGIMTREFFYPCINTLLRALPHTFRTVTAPAGTLVKVEIPTETGGDWFLQRTQSGWQLMADSSEHPTASVQIQPAVAWKLFFKNTRPDEVRDQVTITGNVELGERVLYMVSVMA